MNFLASPDFGLALLGVGLLVFMAVIGWALLKMASDSDDAAEWWKR